MFNWLFCFARKASDNEPAVVVEGNAGSKKSSFALRKSLAKTNKWLYRLQAMSPEERLEAVLCKSPPLGKNNALSKEAIGLIMNTCESHPDIAKSMTFYASSVMPSWAVSKTMPLNLTMFELLLVRGAHLEIVMKFCQDFHPTEAELPPLEEDISLFLLALMASDRPSGILQYLFKTFPSRCRCASDPDLPMRRLLTERCPSLDDLQAIHDVHPVSTSILVSMIETPVLDQATRDFVLEHRPGGIANIGTISVSGESIVEASQLTSYLDFLAKLPLRYTNLTLCKMPWGHTTWPKMMGILSDPTRGVRHLSWVVGADLGVAMNLLFFREKMENVLANNSCSLKSLDLCFEPRYPPFKRLLTKRSKSKEEHGDRFLPRIVQNAAFFCATVIESSKTLKKLWIRTGVMTSRVAEALKCNKAIKFLVIDCLIRGNSALDDLVTAVEKNTTLLYIDIRQQDDESKKAAEKLQEYMRRNRTTMTKAQFVDLLDCPDASYGLAHMTAQFELLVQNVGVWSDDEVANALSPIKMTRAVSPGPNMPASALPVVTP